MADEDIKQTNQKQDLVESFTSARDPIQFILKNIEYFFLFSFVLLDREGGLNLSSLLKQKQRTKKMGLQINQKSMVVVEEEEHSIFTAQDDSQVQQEQEQEKIQNPNNNNNDNNNKILSPQKLFCYLFALVLIYVYVYWAFVIAHEDTMVFEKSPGDNVGSCVLQDPPTLYRDGGQLVDLSTFDHGYDTAKFVFTDLYFQQHLKTANGITALYSCIDNSFGSTHTLLLPFVGDRYAKTDMFRIWHDTRNALSNSHTGLPLSSKSQSTVNPVVDAFGRIPMILMISLIIVTVMVLLRLFGIISQPMKNRLSIEPDNVQDENGTILGKRKSWGTLTLLIVQSCIVVCLAFLMLHFVVYTDTFNRKELESQSMTAVPMFDCEMVIEKNNQTLLFSPKGLQYGKTLSHTSLYAQSPNVYPLYRCMDKNGGKHLIVIPYQETTSTFQDLMGLKEYQHEDIFILKHHHMLVSNEWLRDPKSIWLGNTMYRIGYGAHSREMKTKTVMWRRLGLVSVLQDLAFVCMFFLVTIVWFMTFSYLYDLE